MIEVKSYTSSVGSAEVNQKLVDIPTKAHSAEDVLAIF